MVDLYFPVLCELGQHNGNVRGWNTTSSRFRSLITCSTTHP